MSNSNSAVNTSVRVTPCDNQLLEASSSTADTAEGDSANTTTSHQRPSLNLSQSVARSETLESPAYIPQDFSILPNDVADTPDLEVVRSDNEQADTNAEPKNLMQASSDAHHSHSTVASVSIETETSAAASIPAYEKLMPAQQAASGKTSKFAASVRRKFTVSKTVLPSSAAPQVVVFSKLATEAASPSEVQNVDDVGHVHIVGKAASSDVRLLDKSPAGDVKLSTQPVVDATTASNSTLQSTVITRTGECCADDVVQPLQLDPFECDHELAKSIEIQSATCDENVDRSTENSAEVHSGLCMQQSEVDLVPESCAASEHSAVETSSLACRSVYDAVGPQYKDAEDLPDVTGSDDIRGIVPASTSVSDIGCDNAACECDNELNLLQCTIDELPANNASDDVVAQITDSVAACSTVDHMMADLPFEVSSLSSSKQDALECDNSSHIADSMPVLAAGLPMQEQIDSKS